MLEKNALRHGRGLGQLAHLSPRAAKKPKKKIDESSSDNDAEAQQSDGQPARGGEGAANKVNQGSGLLHQQIAAAGSASAIASTEAGASKVKLQGQLRSKSTMRV